MNKKASAKTLSDNCKSDLLIIYIKILMAYEGIKVQPHTYCWLHSMSFVVLLIHSRSAYSYIVHVLVLSCVATSKGFILYMK